MHSALQVPEVLRFIFECSLDKHSLFNCSLVCRLWAIWASEILWKTSLVSLQAVLQPMASVIRIEKLEDGDEIPYVGIGRINEDSWRQFLALANRVTGIAVDCGIRRASLERIKVAKETFGGEPFSQLRSLKTTIDDEQHWAIALVTVPTLNSVTISGGSLSRDGLTWIADSIPSIAPQITNFRVMHDWKFWVNSSRYSSLKVIELGSASVQPRFWESLSNCQHLRKVVLTYCTRIDYWGLSWSVDLVHFPTLRTLKMCRGDPGVMFCLVRHSTMPMLDCLCWNADGSQPVVSAIDWIAAAHLKLYSPKVDTDMLYSPKVDSNKLYYIGNRDCDDSDSDDGRW